jgi:L-2-hydroxyglutarate oxidase
MKQNEYDFLIIGAGVIGFAVGIALLEENPRLKVIIAEKEKSLGAHASGRNSGVIHAGFYYSPNSLKAKFCKQGNAELRGLIKKHQIPILEIGKVVVTKSEQELVGLNKLFKSGSANGIEIELLDAGKLHKLEPLAITHEQFIWSPNSCVSDPNLIIHALRTKFELLGGQLKLDCKIELIERFNEVIGSPNSITAKFFINAAGAYSDKLWEGLSLKTDYQMIPFLGMYKSTNFHALPIKRLIYPVPHPINPFLGVHFTLTLNNKVKIGPTAIPIFGKEQYSITSKLTVQELIQTFKGIYALVRGDKHSFSELLKTEWPKFYTKRLVKESSRIVPTAINVKGWENSKSGIRSQLVDLKNGELVQDFVVKRYLNSIHILNAVSPGWTSALPFGRYIAGLVLK